MKRVGPILLVVSTLILCLSSCGTPVSSSIDSSSISSSTPISDSSVVDFVDSTDLTSTSEYSIGDTWTVDGQWELTVTGVTETSDRNQFADTDPAAVYIIDYTYKHLGYVDSAGIWNGLFIGSGDSIVDSSGTMGYEYPGSITYYPQETPVGATCNAQFCIGVNAPGSFHFMFSVLDKDNDLQTATFYADAEDFSESPTTNLDANSSSDESSEDIQESSEADTTIVELVVKAALQAGFGDDCAVVVDENNIDARFWSKSYTTTAVLATSLDSAYESWSDTKVEFLELEQTLRELVEENIPSGYTFSVSMTSSEGHDIPLLSATSGIITYDFVEEHRSDESSTTSSTSESTNSAALNLPAFETLKFSGTGDSVLTDIDIPTGAIYYAYISHSGRRNFAIWVYDESEDRDLAVNEIGNYSGYYLFTFDTISRIEITADGNWELAIGQLTLPPDGSEITTLSGSGPYVSYIFDAPSGVWALTHDGSSNFIVYSYVTDGTSLLRKNRDLLVNEIGSYSGEQYISVPAGMHLILSIEADGNWSANLTG